MKTSKGAALILIKDKSALMVLRDDKPEISYPNHWSINGGKVEKGETYREAAIRELEEETGYKSTNPILFMSETYINDKGVRIIAKRFYEVYDGKQILECLEGQEIRFVSLDEIASLKVFPGHDKAVRLAIKKANEE